MAKSEKSTMNNQLSPEQINLMAQALKNAKDLSCKKCEGLIFNQGTKLKQVSRLLTGEEKDSLWPIPTFYCVKCLEELTLEEEKPAEKNEIVIDFKR